MADTKQLYQEVILDHNRKPRNWGAVADATHHAEGLNPLCGDRLQLTVRLKDEAAAVKGKSRADAEQLSQEFRDMATGKLDVKVQPHHLGRLTIFSGVCDLPTRVKCAILPWHTLHAAFNAIESTSTESDGDPMHSPIGGA
jgi:nitrogen fixation protein NifU and related proteins